MRIIIFGPQGSGKGTQAELIAREHGWPYISTGDIFRYHLKNRTELGVKVETEVNSGKLVSDELTNELVRERLLQPDCVPGFVLDGYPRTEGQAQFLDSLTTIDAVLLIDLDDATAIARLGQRLACKCGLSYHPEHNPPKQPGACDRCGQALFRREDDQPEAIAERLRLFHDQTKPLLARYEHKGILHVIDGSKTIDEVRAQISGVLTR